MLDIKLYDINFSILKLYLLIINYRKPQINWLAPIRFEVVAPGILNLILGIL